MDFLQGKKIIHKDNTVSADVVLKKKCLILYYFTGPNCDVCKEFDPKLKQVYYVASDRKLEIAVLIIPSDSNYEAYLSHYKANYHEFFALSKEDNFGPTLIYNYGVTHVPTLIVVRKNGEIVTREGTTEISKIGINVLVTWTE